MSEIIHYDLDSIERTVERFNRCQIGSRRRRYIAEQIVDSVLMNELLNELRCLRERALSPCPDQLGHTHAREA